MNAIKYGFRINSAAAEKKVTYLDHCDNADFTAAHMDYASGRFCYGSWETAFFMPKPCMVSYDGNVDYYLDPSDYAKKADGTTSDIGNPDYPGNAMVEWGRDGKFIWYKTEATPSGDTDVYISDTRLDPDYHAWSFIDHDGNMTEHFYTSIYQGSHIKDRIRSLSGQNTNMMLTAQEEIAGAAANNSAGINAWYTEEYCDIMLINLLLILMGKSTDTASVFGHGNNNTFTENPADGVMDTGSMDDKGLFWGSDRDDLGMKVFGMENWWGNQWRRYAGHVNDFGKQKIKMTYSMADGSAVTGYNLTGEGYLDLGIAADGTTGTPISGMIFNQFGMIPCQASGDGEGYYSGLWFRSDQNSYAFRGGDCHDKSLDGAFSTFLRFEAGKAFWSVGCTLSCRPGSKFRYNCIY